MGSREGRCELEDASSFLNPSTERGGHPSPGMLAPLGGRCLWQASEAREAHRLGCEPFEANNKADRSLPGFSLFSGWGAVGGT